MPFLLLTAIFYVSAILILPGWLVIRWVLGSSLGEWLGPARAWVTPAAVIAVHTIVFVAIHFTLHRFFKLHGIFSQYDAEAPVWLRRLWALLIPRSYRWAVALMVLVIAVALIYLWRLGQLTPEQACAGVATLLGLCDVRSTWIPVIWPDQLPQPRYAFDAVPSAEGEGGFKRVSVAWAPWLPESGEVASISETFAISESEYNTARSARRFPTNPLQHYTRYVTEGMTQSVLRVAKYLRETSEAKRLQQLDELANVAAFVRAVPYAFDEEMRGVAEWADFPVELLYDQAGDCEDHGILAAALLWALGHDVGLFYIELKECAHIALAYKTDNSTGTFSRVADDGSQYFYVETVPVSGAKRVGDVPATFLSELKNATVLPIVPTV